MASPSIPQRVVYAISCVDGRKYVGSTTGLVKRRESHFRHLRAGKNKNRPLQEAWNDLGPTAFRFDVLEVVPEDVSLIEREQWWIDNVPAEQRFNVCPVAGSSAGVIHGAAYRANISAHMAGTEHYRAVLNDDDVRSIRVRRAAGETLQSLATSYGVSTAQVWRIAKRRNWAHVI